MATTSTAIVRSTTRADVLERARRTIAVEPGRRRKAPSARPAAWLLSPDRDDWLPRRACRFADPAIFTPEIKKAAVGSPKRLAAIAPALAICAQCTVRPECAAEAIRLGTADGVVAGVDLGNDYGKLAPSAGDTEALFAIATGADTKEKR